MSDIEYINRCYRLPVVLVAEFRTFTRQRRMPMSHVVSASVLRFMELSPNEREEAMTRFHAYLRENQHV